ncbi:unnamed protein product [Heterobilharzia americana]|nr:unnamed protein product [Heterobilharzia americana]
MNTSECINGDGPKKKVALITGITGQDGSYLAEFLLSKNYIVHGIIRRSSSFNTSRVNHVYEKNKSSSEKKFFLHYGDMTDSSSLIRVISKVMPDEIYNLAAQSHVKVSFELSEYTGEVVALGTLRLLDAIRTCKLERRSSSIKPQVVNCMERSLRRLRMKRHPSIQGHHTVSLSCTLIGLW